MNGIQEWEGPCWDSSATAWTGRAVRILRETYGHESRTGRPVHAYTLDTENDLSIVVFTYGATLGEVRTPGRDGHLDNVVLRLPDLAAYEDRAKNPYVGATIGRYCRCVAGGRFSMDGVEYDLDRNDDRHHVHGGPSGFDRRVWDADAEHDDGGLTLRLSLISPDGDQGYPGELSAETVYRIDGENRLTFQHRATTTLSTIVGFTNHAFWNLAGRGRVNGHELSINSRRVVAFDEELIPLSGPPRLVSATSLDYSTPRTIDTHRIDNLFVLDDPAWAAELADPVSGRVMRVRTTELGMGVYSADHYPRPRAGLCLEAGAWPDAPNRPDFPSVRLDPGETYQSRTVHEFSVR